MNTPTSLIMKHLFTCLWAGALCWGSTATGAILFTYDSGFANSGLIPDGDLTGWQDTRTVSGISSGLTIADLNVTVNLSGGYNGDLYGYLVHDSGFAVLLNRTGRTTGNSAGYGDTGFSLVFDDSAATQDVHLYQDLSPSYNGSGQLEGTWWTDARNVSPGTVLDTDPRTATLASFNTLNPNGSWTLYLADVSSGEQSKVGSWGLEITTTAVPECPSIVQALVVGGVATWVVLCRLPRKKTSPV